MDLKKHEKERVILQEPVKLSGLKIAMLQTILEHEGMSLKNLREAVNKKLDVSVSLPYFSQAVKEMERMGIISRERSYPHYLYIDETVREPLKNYLNALLTFTNTISGAEARALFKQRLEIDQRLKAIAPTLVTKPT